VPGVHAKAYPPHQIHIEIPLVHHRIHVFQSGRPWTLAELRLHAIALMGACQISSTTRLTCLAGAVRVRTVVKGVAISIFEVMQSSLR
jgi:hypothetical protein